MVLGITPSTKFVYSLGCRTKVRQLRVFIQHKGAVALRCGSFVFLSNTKRRASKSPAFVV